MTYRSRRDDLQALGLIDWTFRSGGPLDGAPQAPNQSLHTAGEAQATPAVPVAPAPEAEPMVDAPEPSTARELADDTPDRDPEPTATTVSEASSEPTAGSTIAAMDWADLEAHLHNCDHRGATRPVFGVGAHDADVLIVGEAPGANEDEQGVPFVGRAGKLLDRMLFAIGCSRERNVYITNICKFRPPDNRDPSADEVAADWPTLERQIDLMAPRLVVAVGRVAAQTLLDSKEPLRKMRGRMHRYPQRELDVLVTYHPAYLLRSPQQKAKAWDDLRAIARHIGSFAP